jgi:Heparinase II/III-like protein.
MRKTFISTLLIVHVLIATAQTTPYPIVPINEKRVAEIEKMLPDKPAGFGDPYSNRTVWDRLLASGEYDRFLRGMRTFSFPPFSRKDYFSLADGTASNSSVGLTMMRKRAEGLSKLAWAECLENNNQYTGKVEAALRDIINQRSWVSPRSDHEFKNYNGIEYSVELTSSLYAHTIAQTLYMMGNKISPKLRKQAIDALYLRIFNPLLETIKTGKGNNFLTETNNWNHVCLAGLVGAALTVIESKRERAVFVHIGEYYSRNGLMGFGEDGYCTEGITYFNYGFGHYAVLREIIWQATSGKIDLFDHPKVQKIAQYPLHIQIINGVIPAISDCREGSKADTNLLIYLNRSLGLGLAHFNTRSYKTVTSDNRRNLMTAFPNSTHKAPLPTKGKTGTIVRSFFNQAGVLVCRPMPGSSAKTGVALKGGNNGESHNHNDIGSYSIVQGNEIMAGDPGSIPYTADYFNPEYRYTYKTAASYGHPVPLVADSTQKPGHDARTRVIDTVFTPEKDIITIDIASAYNVPGLKKLERTMEYNRSGAGSISFTDVFEYAQPAAFETAITSRSKWKQTSDSTLLLSRGKEKMVVTFLSPGNQLVLRSEEITEGGAPYTRIGIAIVRPVASGRIVVNYKPLN